MLSNHDIGKALDVYRLTGSKSPGATAVQNALIPGRKLTHDWAKRLVVGLFLAEPLWKLTRQFEADERRLQERASAGVVEKRKPVDIAAANFLEGERGILREFVSLLVAFKAVSLSRPPQVPAFIPRPSINELADGLSAAAAVLAGVGGEKMRPALAQAMRAYLHRNAAGMARAWADAANHTSFGDTIALLARAAFGDDYFSVAAMPSWGPEFDLLGRERPLLADIMWIPETGAEDE